VAVPSYDRGALTPAVVHLSVGHFHRSHQAVYFDALARRGNTEWGLTGVGLRGRELHDALTRQDGLFTVVERGAGPDRARIVGAMGRFLFGPDDPQAVVDALADERTRLVTLTVTAAGYDVEAASGPRDALWHLVAGLDRRRRAGLPPFTVLSCDNVPANGEVARAAVVAYARLRDEGLARWIEDEVAFPSSMVDRITPTTTDADRAHVAETFGVADRWPVMTEPYSEWIVEDAFCNGRPPLEDVGVRFVADVRPYGLIKTRLLNATHCALGYLGSLAGLTTTGEALDDPVFAAYVDQLTGEEIAPLLPRLPGLDVGPYRQTVLERLGNPKIGDRLERLCRAGELKVPRHVLPSVAASRERGRPHPLLTLALAGFVVHARARVAAVAADPALAHEVRAAVDAIERDGARPVVAAALAAESVAA
jgi:mannitol 2-dehydrogenase